MEQYHELLLGTTLFNGFTKQELSALLRMLAPTLRFCQKGEILLMAGDEARQMGIVLSGGIEAVKTTRDGTQFTLTHMGVGGVFGDVLSAGNTKSPVSIAASEAGQVMWLPAERFFSAEPKHAALYLKLLENLVGVMSDKYFALNERVDLLLIHSLRRKIASYLLSLSRRQKSDTLTVRLSRTALAAYLGCERSALSREISRMVSDGLIGATRTSFTIIDRDALRELG